MFFLKPLLKEKDARIAQLEQEVGFLRSLLQPVPQQVNRNVHHEANAILSGHQEQIVDDSPISAEEMAIIAERERILSGTY